MDTITLHGVNIRKDAFKSAKEVKDANLFGHLSDSAAKEAELIEQLGLKQSKPVKSAETIEPAKEETKKPT